MSTQVQQLVDELADKLQRSVAVDDPDIQLIAASPQVGTIDRTRMDVILSRTTKPEVIQFARSLHLEHARLPVRVQGAPEMDILPRVAFPLRALDELYGYLWLIDSPTVSETEVQLGMATAFAIARMLADEARAADVRYAEDDRLVASLLSSDADRQQDGLARAERTGRLRVGTPWRVVVVRQAMDGSAGGDASYVAHPANALRGVLGQTLSGLVDGDFVVISADPGWGPQPFASRPAVRPVWDRLSSALLSRGLPAGTIGVSTLQPGEPLRTVWARARFCAEVGARGPVGPAAVHWEQLGAWQLLYGLPWTADTVRLLHPGIEVLLEPQHRDLAVTLATYLDRGGDSQATVEALCVHRATLYYRRGRIRELIGTDWERGWSRVGTHAALMLAGLLDPTLAPVPTARAEEQGGR